MADLLYLGRGRWMVGTISGNAGERARRARVVLRKQYARPHADRDESTIRTAIAATQGFRVFSKYTASEVLSHLAVREFRTADYIYRQGREKAYQELESEGLDPSVAEEKLREEAIDRAKEYWGSSRRFHIIPSTL